MATPKVNGFFFRLVANGFEDKYPIGWKIQVERCPFTRGAPGIDYVGDEYPKLGKSFGTFVMPNSGGKKANVICTKIEPGWEAPEEE